MAGYPVHSYDINTKMERNCPLKGRRKIKESTHKTETPMAQDAPPVLPKQKLQ